MTAHSPSKTGLEFDRQVDTLLQKGYPAAAGLSESAFTEHILPLRPLIENLQLPEPDLVEGRLPFVIVVRHDLLPVHQSMSLVQREGKEGIVKLYPREPDDFQVIDSVRLPEAPVYLLVNIDRGRASINLTPDQAMRMIIAEGRSPLTIDEGIAVVTQFPEYLMKNNCFSLLASRCPADKRVPAIWINGQKQPNLGWCWAGNPHTWLGSASCVNRLS